MKRLFLFFILFFLIYSVNAKELSSDAKVKLMIVGPYQGDFASVWGHIAIWIKDDKVGVDRVYNYGGVAYEGNFIYRMLTGNLRFYLDTHQTYEQELKTYKRAKRDVALYELNLKPKEKQKIYDLLEENSKEENKFYRYEFYLKNCATFTYDIIVKSIDGNIDYKDNGFDITYRDVFDDRLSPFPFPLFLIQVISGSKNDQKLELEETFFIPKYMANSFKTASIKDENGSRPVFKNSKVVFDFPETDIEPSFFKKPIFLFLLLFLVEIVLFGFSYFRQVNYFKLYDNIWFGFMSILSLFTLLTMILTHYLITKVNFNLLWSNPLVVFVFILKGVKKEIIFKILSVLNIVFIIGYFFIPQHIYIVSLLISGILLMKTLKYGFLKNHFFKTT